MIMSRKNSGRQGFLRQLDSMLGRTNQRRKKQSAFSAPAEHLEVRQLLAADLAKVLEQAAILDTVGPTDQVNSYFVVFTAPMDASAIQAATGATSVTPYAPIPNTFDVRYTTAITLQTAADRISTLSNFKSLAPTVEIPVETRMIPNDTFFPAQWYLNNTGQTNGTPGADLNVTGVWDTYNGNGVTVAVVDDGVDIQHQDLIGKVVLASSLDLVGGGGTDPTPFNTANSIHGTGVAGIIAAVGNNSRGITGTAFGASIAGIRLISQGANGATFVSASTTATALTHALGTISVSNNSWGPRGNGDIAVLPIQVSTALNTGTTTGRNGNGIIYVWAAGNGGASGDYVNYDPYASSRNVIAVGAVDDSAVHSAYSERGASLLVSAYSAPSAIMTLDLRDDFGVNADPAPNAAGTPPNPDPDQERYNGVLLNRNYTRRLAADTSTAAAQVSGVAALMLEANPNLSYRDVMEILIDTARRADPGDIEWTQNGAGRWINYKYGFGVVDAQAAVDAAVAKIGDSPRAPLVNENTPTVQVSTLIPDFAATGVTATVDATSALSLEHVELVLTASHARRGDLRVTLTSPDGTQSVMAEQRTVTTGQNYAQYTFTTPRFWGEESIGTWTVRVQDLLNGVTGTFNNFQLRFYGTELPLALAASPRTFREDAGVLASTGTVSRPASANLSVPLTVNLTSSDTSELTVPATVTILPGRRSVTFAITAIDDTLLDGTQTARITASIGSYSTDLNLDVLDHETLSVVVNPVAFNEDAGPGAATMTITRSNTNIDPPNKIVAVNNELRTYDDAGMLVTTTTIPWPTGSRPVGQDAHDVVVMDNGNIAVYNGTATVFLSVLNVGNGVWTHTSVAELSTTASDAGTGGISTTGDFVFLTDMKANVNDAFGLVRVNARTGVVNRFGTQSFGNRLFTNTLFDSSIYEISPIDGSIVKEIPLPLTGSQSGSAGMAFDGAYIWYMLEGTSTLYKIDPDAQAPIVASYALNTDPTYLQRSRSIDGLGWLNGELYLADPTFSVISTNSEILVFDPITARITRTIPVGNRNGIWLGSAQETGLTGNPANNSLFVTGRSVNTSNYEIYEITTTTGQIINQFPGDVWDSGLAVVGNELFVGSRVNSTVRVFDLAGALQRTFTLPASNFFFSTYSLGSDGLPGLVPTTLEYRDTTVGLDGMLYALDVNGSEVGIFNPNTLAVVKFITLAVPSRAITVAADGTIYGAADNGDIVQYSATGSVIRTFNSGLGVLNDIDLNNTGKILLSNTIGEYATTDTLLAVIDLFNSSPSNAFVSFGESAVVSTADLIVTITNPDPTELSVPLTVVIPAGQSSVTVPIDAIDDAIRDGAQQVVVSVSAPGYFGDNKTIVVLDSEGVKVDVVADSISEAAGVNATSVNVSRTDTSGPFTHQATQQFTNSGIYDIPDAGRVYVPIVVPNQVSRITDLNVTLSFQHQWLGDLDVYLISPSGKRVELFTDLTNNGTLMTNTVFDDQANSSILTGSQPYTGRFMPEGKLSDFIMESTAGTWLLEVNDDNSSDIGRLLGWSMAMQTLGLAPVTVVLQTSNPNKATFNSGSTITVVIPANQSEILVPLNAVDNALLDGTVPVTISATSTNITDFGLDSDSVDVIDSETMNLVLTRSSVLENAGSSAIIGTLTRGNTDIGLPYIVFLTSSNTNKLTVPTSVTIPAGSASVTFPINAVDNNVLDGDTLVTISAIAPAYVPINPQVVTVIDVEPVLKLSTSTPIIAENAGSFTVVVERQDQNDVSLPMTVTITAGLGLAVPPTVTIPANTISLSFNVSVLDNAILDGTRSSSIQASAIGITGGSLVVTITDYETLTVTASKTSFLENAGSTASIGTVTRSNTGNLSQPLIVTLTSSDTSEATVPATVTIPAGQASVTFPITAVNDTAVDGSQNVTITATATNFVGGTLGIVVEDHEPPVISGPGAVTALSRPTITWNALVGALRYDIWISNLSSGISQIVRNINVQTNSFVPPENLGIGRYRVWVRAINQEEVAGVWSVGKDFFVNTRPVITSPSPTVTIANTAFPTITWSAVPDATKYELWVDNLTTNKAQVIYRAGTTALTTSSFTSPVDLPSGTYKIWVRALNAQSEAGLWSTGVVLAVLARPVISQPNGGGTFDRTPTFSWSAVTSATNYDLWVGDAKTRAVVIRNQFVKTTTFTALQDLPVGDYQVWVRAQSGNSYSSWSQVTLFSVGLPPKITSARLVGTPARAQFTWTTIAGTEKYELWVTNTTTNVRVIHQTALDTTTYTHNAPLATGTYRVWVRAVSTMGEITAWSSPVDLVVASAAGSMEAMDALQSTMLTSAMTTATRTANESPIEPPGAVVEDTLTLADEQPIVLSNVHVTDEPAAVVNPVMQPVTVADSEFDAVMAEWQSADWWVETSPSSEKHESKSAAALAASLGLVVRSGKDSDERRKNRN